MLPDKLNFSVGVVCKQAHPDRKLPACPPACPQFLQEKQLQEKAHQLQIVVRGSADSAAV